MNPDAAGQALSLDLVAWRRIERACARFEADWAAGPPDLPSYVGDATGAERDRLVAELVLLDLEFRLRRGEEADRDHYRALLPDDVGPIESAFRALTPTAPQGDGPDPAEWDTWASFRLAPRVKAAAIGPGASARLREPPAPPCVPGYELLGEVGRGGMGVVYRARHVRLDRPCALKMIRAGELADPETSLRFLAEAETVARLRHPNIVQIYRLGDSDGRPYVELEYLDGGSLSDRIKGEPRPPAESARLIETLARAVGEAHRLGVVHRDLKPSNILLTVDGTPKVADFGLAKRMHLDSDLTRTEMIVGTPSYMAPEQAAGKYGAVGPAADTYSLGAILYEMLTGRPPFKAASVLETLELVKTTDPLSPSRLVPGLPRDVETIALTCLQKDPARRYASAGALAEDLRRFQAGEPIAARPVGPLEQYRMWARRHATVARLVAALVLAVALGFAAVTAQWLRAEGTRIGLEARARQAEENDLLAIEALASHLDALVASGRPADPVEGATRRRFLDSARRSFRTFLARPRDDPRARRLLERIGLRLKELSGG